MAGVATANNHTQPNSTTNNHNMSTPDLTKAEKFAQCVKECDAAQRKASQAVFDIVFRLTMKHFNSWLNSELGNTRKFMHNVIIPDVTPNAMRTAFLSELDTNMNAVCSLAQEVLVEEGFDCVVQREKHDRMAIVMVFNV